MDNFATVPRKRQAKDEGLNLFQERLQDAMRAKGVELTNAALASHLKLRPQTTHNWFDKGRYQNMAAKHLFLLADKLDVNPRWLFCDKGWDDPAPSQKIDPERRRALSCYDELEKLDKETGGKWLDKWIRYSNEVLEEFKKVPSVGFPFTRK